MDFFFDFYYFSILLNEALDAKNILANCIFFILDYLDGVSLMLKHCMENPHSKKSFELKFLLKVGLNSRKREEKTNNVINNNNVNIITCSFGIVCLKFTPPSINT